MPTSAADRSRATVGRVLESLGTTLLEVACGDPDPAAQVGGVVIHDPLDPQLPPPGALVLAVGLQDPGAVAELLRDLGRHGCAALVVRAPARVEPEVVGAVEASGVSLLGLVPGATWTQLAAMLRALLRVGDLADVESETLGGLPSGDLFALANAIAALLDAPITIEDRDSRVLAFSGRQEEADEPRIETVIGRRVPDRFSRYLADNGIFRKLYSSREPVYVDPAAGSEVEFSLSRAAIAVRAGDEVLGSIWAAVPGRLSPERTQALCDAAKLVALHLLRVRAGADVERRLHADLLSTALEGGGGANQALARLGLTDQHVVVLAMGVLDVGTSLELGADASLAVRQEHASDALVMHLTAVHPRCSAALLGDVTYGLLPVGQDESGEERAEAIARNFIHRVGDRVPVAIGIGPIARPFGGLTQARAGADRTLRVLRAEPTTSSLVARLEDVQVKELILELGDLVAERGDRPVGPVARLLAHDRQRDGSLLPTLRAYLDSFGDAAVAASLLHVHPNTFRYRLRRLREVCGLDLTDPEARFAAMLQLRVVQEFSRAAYLPGNDRGSAGAHR